MISRVSLPNVRLSQTILAIARPRWVRQSLRPCAGATLQPRDQLRTRIGHEPDPPRTDCIPAVLVPPRSVSYHRTRVMACRAKATGRFRTCVNEDGHVCGPVCGKLLRHRTISSGLSHRAACSTSFTGVQLTKSPIRVGFRTSLGHFWPSTPNRAESSIVTIPGPPGSNANFDRRCRFRSILIVSDRSLTHLPSFPIATHRFGSVSRHPLAISGHRHYLIPFSNHRHCFSVQISLFTSSVPFSTHSHRFGPLSDSPSIAFDHRPPIQVGFRAVHNPSRPLLSFQIDFLPFVSFYHSISGFSHYVACCFVWWRSTHHRAVLWTYAVQVLDSRPSRHVWGPRVLWARRRKAATIR